MARRSEGAHSAQRPRRNGAAATVDHDGLTPSGVGQNLRMSCVGSLILHADGTVAACTEDDEPDACAGRDVRHEGDPKTCVAWYGGCNRCGIIQN